MECDSRQALDMWRDISTRSIKAEGPDLTARQTALLLTVHLDAERYTVRALAKRLGLQKPAIVRAIDALQAMGFVRRIRDPKDKRSIFVEPTSEGELRLGNIATIISEGLSNISPTGFDDTKNYRHFESNPQIQFAAQ